MVLAIGLVLLLLVALIVAQARALSRCRFWCRSCGALFALPWTKLLFRQHVNGEWWLICPHCGKKGWCTVYKPKEGDGT